MQVVAPSDDIVPALQLAHDDGSSELGMVPAGHALHSVAPSVLTLPAAHDEQLDDAAVLEYVPARQSVHESAAVPEMVPASQSTQVLAPALPA